jgi:hypothetical protein
VSFKEPQVNEHCTEKLFSTYFKCFSNFSRVHIFDQLKEIKTPPLNKEKNELGLNMVLGEVTHSLSLVFICTYCNFVA